MRTYLPMSFVLKLAAFCLVVGFVAGMWLSSAARSTPDSQPTRSPATQVPDQAPGHSRGADGRGPDDVAGLGVDGHRLK